VVYRFSGPNIDTQLIYQFHKTGYLNTDDWDEYIKKDALLLEIKQNTEATNKIRKPGYSALHVDGWIQEPILDKTESIVYWAISLHTSEGTKIVNAKILKLGRKGYTEIIWIGIPDKFSNAENSLTPALKAYQFNEGLTYADYDPIIDNIAPIGIGALTYKLIKGPPLLEEELRLAMVAQINGDYKMAAEKFKPFLAQGNPIAQYVMSSMYREGQGVLQDFKEAFKLLKLAAEQGHSTARSDLAVAYINGKGVEPNPKKALALFLEMATIAKDIFAQVNLGKMYRDGLGVIQNYTEAHKWFNIAGANYGQPGPLSTIKQCHG
jgi:hypothetical protein